MLKFLPALFVGGDRKFWLMQLVSFSNFLHILARILSKNLIRFYVIRVAGLYSNILKFAILDGQSGIKILVIFDNDRHIFGIGI